MTDKKKHLVLKFGASGDVLRTTTLLHVLKGDVWWVTTALNAELIPRQDVLSPIKVLTAEEANIELCDQHFDTVISLDDEPESVRLGDLPTCDRRVGTYLDDAGKVKFTAETASWFEMGLLSDDGIEVANQRKLENTRSYQSHLFGMFDKPFEGQEYVIDPPPNVTADSTTVAIEMRAGDRWPTKRWNGYSDLAAQLESRGFRVRILQQCPNLKTYIREIAECEFLICGDTLAMHIALGLKKRVTAIFTCTPAHEIYDYGRLAKVISPHLADALYRRDYIPEAVESISTSDVLNAFETLQHAD